MLAVVVYVLQMSGETDDARWAKVEALKLELTGLITAYRKKAQSHYQCPLFAAIRQKYSELLELSMAMKEHSSKERAAQLMVEVHEQVEYMDGLLWLEL